MNIQVATPADAHKLVSLAVPFREHLARLAPSNSEFSASIRLLLAAHDAEFYIASAEGQPVGYVLLRYRHSMWANGLEATIEDLFVTPTLRKQGTGKALIQFALARANRAGCKSACLDTNEFNVASTKIYSDLGFNAVSKRWNGRQIFFRKEL
ncbi:GNAT family N-acetyltransferase [Rhodoferax sp. WC2427]|uniref:GNAT family N-acetyltransferase n=1 Tax=Rhodoferax sp. WC2427 TaxID=3234144 RepID=UPI0034665399